MKEIIDIVHKSILPFFDVCENEEEPLSDKDKLLLKVNKAICNNLKALKRESCDDAISRQAVIEIFGYVMDYWKEHAIDVEPHEIKDTLIEQYEFTAKQLSELPSVKPQEKIGHWIRGHHGFGCSNCHKSIEGKWDDNIDDITGTLFCPNCGARMESEEKE